MKASRITVLRDTSRRTETTPGACVYTFAEVCRELRSSAWKHLFRYDDARLHTSCLESLRRPFLTALLMRLLCRGRCVLADEGGAEEAVTPRSLVRRFSQLLGDCARKGRALRRIERAVDALATTGPGRYGLLDRTAAPIYLRTDLVFGSSVGGSVGHIAGVLNNLGAAFGPPLFFTTNPIATVSPAIATHVIRPGPRFWDFPHVPAFLFNKHLAAEVRHRLGERRPAFVYQRYCLNNYAGVELARGYGVPLVLEFNGSEIWINRNWGKRPARKYERLGKKIERLNLRAADLLVVVSQPLKDQLAGAGIPEERILVNPNGVDLDRYSPAVDGTPVRRRHGLDEYTVVGFIGTFGPWHGPEVLVEAIGRLLREEPAYRQRLRLLLIGDGVTMPLVRDRIDAWQLDGVCIRTGLIPQEQGPGHLAACDVLAAPHVPNADGSPFFGSPTKLFEYMAMGKGIVASDLGQIGEVLEHNRTALLVQPGCAVSLAAGLKDLIDEPRRRARLGAAARSAAVARHSWRGHTERIVQALHERCGGGVERRKAS